MPCISNTDAAGYTENTSERQLLRKCVSERDRTLLPLLFGENVTREKIAYLTDGIDLDTEGSTYMLLLGSIGFKQGWQFFQPLHAARFRGLHRYYQARNMITVPWLVKQLAKLAEAEIEVLLLGDTAIQRYTVGECPRMSVHYDIAVHPERMDKAVKILGKELDKSVDLSGNAVFMSPLQSGLRDARLELQTAEANMGSSEDGIWKRAKKIKMQSLSVFVPSPEDLMLYLICHKKGELYVWEDDMNGRLLREYTSMVMSRKTRDFSTERLLTLAKETKRIYSTYFWCRGLQYIIPDPETERILERCFPHEQEYQKWLKYFL